MGRCSLAAATRFSPSASLWLPPDLTIWDVAAAPSSHVFVLIGVTFLLPMILFYTAFVYWTFRGKVKADAGYH